MTKSIAIFRKEDYGKASTTGRYLVESLKKHNDFNIIDVFYEDVIFILKGSEQQLYICQNDSKPQFMKVDLVYLRGYSHSDTRQSIAKYCKVKNIPFLNTENGQTSPTSKLAQYLQFSINNIAFPETVIVYPKNIRNAVVLSDIKYPFILKSVDARGGSDNYLIHNNEQLQEVIENLNSDTAYAIQSFINNNGDYRVIVFMDRVLLVYKRKSAGDDYRNNVLQGGKRIIIEDPDNEMKTLAINVSQVLHREITGIDIIIDSNGSMYVLEANFNFGIAQKNDGVDSAIIDKMIKAFNNYLDQL